MPKRLGAMAALAPSKLPLRFRVSRPDVFPAGGKRRKRVALLAGCAQQVLLPSINEATIRLLTRHGCEVVVSRGARCCGALVLHMGRATDALRDIKANIDAWMREIDGEGLDAIVINASGCGTTVKDYGYMLRNDPAWAAKAQRVSSLARDISELLAELGLAAPMLKTDLAVAYHDACSLQHGQKVTKPPRDLLTAAGFKLREIPEGHLCCGSAGTYNLLQPELASRLLARKTGHIASIKPDVIAGGNIGCLTQLASGTRIPVVHTVELLDWATGGPLPRKMQTLARLTSDGR